MAETYKGLTIRIGGDTTKLQQSLRAADSAITNTQSQLRKMTQALRFDPSNTKAAVTNLELMADKAVEVNRRLSELRDAQRAVSNQRVELFGGRESAKTIQQLAEETEEVSIRAANAKDNYTKLNAELEKLYRPINKAAQKAEEFGEAFDIREVGDLESIRADLISIGAATDEQIDKILELRPLWRDAFDENEIAKAVLQARDLNSEITKTEAEAKAVSSAFLQMSQSSSRMRLASGIDDELRSISTAADSTADHIDRCMSVLKGNPTNVLAIREAMVSLEDATKLAERRAELLRQKISELEDAGAKDMPNDMAEVAMSAQRAAQQFDEASNAAHEMRGEIEKLNAEQERLKYSGKTDTEQYRANEAAIESMRAELEGLIDAQQRASRALDMSTQNSELREAKVQLAEVTDQYERLQRAQKDITSSGGLRSNTFMELGMTLSTSVTPAMTAMGYAAVQSARDIDSAYRDMRKTVNGTEEDFERLRQSAIDFSTTHVTSADQILSIQAIGGELGVAVEDLETFAQTVSNLEVATDLGADEAATALGQLDNIMDDLNGSTMPAFSDALVRLGNNGASTESQIVDIAARIGSMSSIIGMSTPEVLAWASTIASTGQGAEAAGTAIANTMSDIEQAVARGGESLDAFATVAQMTSESFAAAWENDPSAALEAFIKGLVAVEEQGGSATATLDDLEIRAARQVQAIEGLMQTVGMLDDNLQMSSNAWNGVSDQWGEAGDAASEASKKADGFSGSIQRLLNMAQVLGAELGESIGPWVDMLADGLGELTNVISEMPDSGKQLIVALGGIAAAAGPLLLFARAIGSTIQDVSKGMKLASATTEAFAGVAGSTSSTLLGLKGGLVALGVAVAAVGIGALVAAFADAQEKAENFRKSTEGLSDAVDDTKALDDYKGNINDIAVNADNAAMSLDELTESTAKHVDAMNENNKNAQVQIEQLDRAGRAIQQYAGQTDLSTEAQGRLQWALQLLNDQLGMNLTAQDVMNGSYTDSEGNIRNLISTIDELIAKKKEEAMINAASANLEEAYKAQSDAAATLAEKQQEVNDKVDYYMRNGDVTRERAEEMVKSTDAYREMEGAQDVYNEATRAAKSYENQLGLLAQAQSDASDEYSSMVSRMDSRKFALFNAQVEQSGSSFAAMTDDLRMLGVDVEKFVGLNEDELAEVAGAYDGTAASIIEVLQELGVTMSGEAVGMVNSANNIQQALQDLGDTDMTGFLTEAGYDLDALSYSMAQAGISVQDLNNVGSAALSAFAASADGNINRLIFLIQNYNGTPILNKDGTVTVDQTQLIDANNNVYDWNGKELLNKDGTVVAEQVTLVDALGNFVTWNGTELVPIDGEASAEYSSVVSAFDWIMELLSLDGFSVSGRVTTTREQRTIYTTIHDPGRSSGVQRTAAVPAQAVSRMYQATQQSASAIAAASAAKAAQSGISLMSDVPDLASRASTISYENSLIGVRTVSRGLDSEHGIGGLTRMSNLRAPREQAQTNVNVTIDGTGTTGRIETKVLDLLDELERLGAI